MGDKNNTSFVTSSNTLAKTGHGVLKAIYQTQTGDRIFSIYDGTSAAGTLIVSTEAGTGVHLLPYINHPVKDGLFINVDSGTTGSVLVVYE